jgi:hypothetical protein
MAELGAVGFDGDAVGIPVVFDVAFSWNITNNPISCFDLSSSTSRAVPRRENWIAYSGTVAFEGTPVARLVRAIERDTGRLVAAVMSNASTGAYSLLVPFGVEVQIVCLDDDAGSLANDRVHRVIGP